MYDFWTFALHAFNIGLGLAPLIPGAAALHNSIWNLKRDPCADDTRCVGYLFLAIGGVISFTMLFAANSRWAQLLMYILSSGGRY